MKLTWFDANTWLIEAGNKRVLIDPWLVGDLIFKNMPWLVRGSRQQAATIPQNIDLILLSQGLADHAHPPTLKKLDKSIPILASPDGAKVAKGLGYQSVTVLNHGDTLCLDDIKIQTFMGAVVGATKRENAYVLTFLADGTRLYYEPHGYPDTEHLSDIGSVDVAITPMADQTLMGIAPVIRGGIAAPQIADLLKPRVMLPTAEAGRVTYDGLISPTLTTKGGAAKMRSRFAEKGRDIRIIQPVSEEPIELDLPALTR